MGAFFLNAETGTYFYPQVFVTEFAVYAVRAFLLREQQRHLASGGGAAGTRGTVAGGIRAAGAAPANRYASSSM